LVDHAAAECQNPSARIADREYQAVAKPVVVSGAAFAASRIALDDQSGLRQLTAFLVLRAEAVEQGIPGIRRVPKGELRGGGRIHSAHSKIFLPAHAVREVLFVESGGPRHDLMQVGASRIAGALSLARQLDSRALRQIRHRIEKSQLLVLHQEADHRAVRAAAETVIELLVGTDPERRRFFVVKRAAGLEFAARFLQRHPRADDLHDIGSRDDLVDERLWNAAGHGDRARSTAELGFDLRPDSGHIGTALRLGLHDGHDLSHVLDA
jgi:hypothetical protein